MYLAKASFMEDSVVIVLTPFATLCDVISATVSESMAQSKLQKVCVFNSKQKEGESDRYCCGGAGV